MAAYSEELHDTCLGFLDETEARMVLDQMEAFRLKNGEPLFKPDEWGDRLFVIVRGCVAVLKPANFEGKMQVVALLDRGAPVGEGALLEAGPRKSLVSAVDDCELLALNQEDFTKIQTENPALAAKILCWLLARVGMRLQKNSARLALVL